MASPRCGIFCHLLTRQGYRTCLWNDTTKTEYTRSRARFESDLTDEEWILVEPCLPPPAKRGRPRKIDLREVFNTIQYMRDAGCQWRAIPPCFPPVATVQYYFYLWRDDGERQALGLRCGQEGQGAQAPHLRRRRRAPDQDRRPPGFGAGSGRGSGGDPPGAGEGAAHYLKIWADGGHQCEKLASALKKLGIESDLEIVKNPRMSTGSRFSTAAGSSRCRRLAKDCKRSLESSLA